MPKRKEPETINDIINEIDSANDTIKDAVCDDNIQDKPQESFNKRDQLLKLAEDGDLDKSVAYIKKASQKIIDKLYTEYEKKRLQKTNEFLTDLVISKFSDILKGFDAIEDPKELTKQLKSDDLLKRDVYSLVEKVSPLLPFLGFLSGSVTTIKHVYEHKNNKSDIKSEE